MDVIVIGALLVFFAAATGYVVFCDRVVASAATVHRHDAEADGDG
jgi:hypothetical protein